LEILTQTRLRRTSLGFEAERTTATSNQPVLLDRRPALLPKLAALDRCRSQALDQDHFSLGRLAAEISRQVCDEGVTFRSVLSLLDTLDGPTRRVTRMARQEPAPCGPRRAARFHRLLSRTHCF
jgi:hypothetical protein